MSNKGYDERPLTLAPILGASGALWLARGVRDRLRPRRGGAAGQAVPEHGNLELTEVFDRQSPVVIRSAATRWSVFENYQPARLREKYRTEKVYALTSTTNVFTQETSPVELLEYGDVMAAMFDSPDPAKKYYSRAAADPTPLAEQLPARIGGRTQSTAASSVWMGQAGNLTPLHNDPWHGLLIQLHGRKRVRLFPPDEYRNVYGRVPTRVNDPYTALPDEFDPDLGAVPRLREAESYDVLLDTGDVLYIPMFWWHQVESVDSSISYVARYNPRYLEFMRAAFFPMGARGVLRIVAQLTAPLRRRKK